MPATRHCHRCGQPIPDAAPGGECPVCLMQLSLDQLTPDPPPAATPSPADLRAHFPDLEVIEAVGRGGMGVVYRARQVELNRPVALKLLTPDRAADPAFAERFLREAQALARLTHPHVVAVYDVGRAAGSVFIVMEYVEGASLRDRLRAGRLPPADALRVIPQLCDAIQYAHDHGVIHRDIKPENVLLDRAGNVKIADFGLAKLDGGDEFTLTGAGDRMGTARYMAPEQWADAAGVDHRADIYSLGVLFYEMLTGDLPTPQYTPPSAKAGSDPRLDRVVSRSLRDSPTERYQRAAEIKTDVERIAATSRWRRPGGFAAAGLLLAGVAAGVAWWPRGGPPPADPPGVFSPTDILTSPDWVWTPPENPGPPVNGEYDDSAPFPTADGLALLFRSTRPGGHGDGDLWECRRPSPDAPFGEPVNLGPVVNSPDDDDAPCLTADGLLLAFVSKRGGRPAPDIWLAKRATTAAPWEPPEPPGPEVNSDAAEYRPWLSPDGLSLTFSSMRPPRPGLWVCRRATRDETFGPPAPYAPASESLAVGQVSFSADGRTLLCNRYNRAYPGDLLWLARIDDPDHPLKNLTSLGPIVNTQAVDTHPAAAADGRTVYFDSDRPGGHGGRDIWLTRRVPKR